MAIWKSEYFYGNKISDYGLQEGYVDYATLAKCFQAVMCNDILCDSELEFEQIGGVIDYTEEIEELQWKIDDLEEEKEELEEAMADLSEEALATTRQDIWARIQGLEEEYQSDINHIDNEILELEAQIEDLKYDEENPPEIFQYYIVSSNAVDILALNNEIVFYSDKLDMYVWGVTHWGTSWDYVLTDIKIELDK